ncbi:hypothetical protein NEOLEDRAFT_1026282, partial [Neolentinus lepideus HHB14362 ss-1]
EQRDAAYEIRITPGGKMQAWVTNALDFLQKNESKPLILHTLPAKKTQSMITDAAQPVNATKSKNQGKQGLSPSTAAVPRLISVVEIIKREFVKLDGSPEERTLHQYNEMGCLEQPGETDEDTRRNALMKALEGKNHLRIAKQPYMKVTLCRQEIPGMKATYQGQVAKRLSRSAKERARKK